MIMTMSIFADRLTPVVIVSTGMVRNHDGDTTYKTRTITPAIIYGDALLRYGLIMPEYAYFVVPFPMEK